MGPGRDGIPLSGMETAEVGACGGRLVVNFGLATVEMFIKQVEVLSRPCAVWVWSLADQLWARDVNLRLSM